MTSTDSMLCRRNATLTNLVELLKRQQVAKLDAVVPAAAIRSVDGALQVAGLGGEPVLTPDGVTTPPGIFRPTAVCDTGLSEKLGIPAGYLRRMREQRPALLDANINTWLGDAPHRRFLLRGLRGQDNGPGIARAFLSDSYRIVDNLDVLLAALAGIKASGAATQIVGCDLTERRMYVLVQSADVSVHAPALLAGYRSPFTGAAGADNPLVFAGFVISNSETGNGSFSLTPRITVQVCNNGMTITRDALREIHLGARLDEGVIRWSATTQQTALDLITRKATDAVTTFLDHAYIDRTLAAIQDQAGVHIRDVPATVEHVAKELRFTAEQQQTILDHFIDAGDRTAGGILHAITSTAQTQPDADDAHTLERHALRAMTLAATHQR
jgi:hypothetical protein